MPIEIDKHLKGKTPLQILKVPKHFGINQMLIKRTLDRYNETPSVKDRPRKERPRTPRTPKLCKNVREKIRRSPKKLMQKIAKEFQISKRSMRRLGKDGFNIFSYKIQKRPLLSAATVKKKNGEKQGYFETSPGWQGEILIFSLHYSANFKH